MEAQRQELMSGFDDAQRKREHEFRKKADDLSNSLLASELKVCKKPDQGQNWCRLMKTRLSYPKVVINK